MVYSKIVNVYSNHEQFPECTLVGSLPQSKYYFTAKFDIAGIAGISDPA